MAKRVALLSGGTGGAKLAAGLQEILGEDLTVIANTGDDIEIYDAYVSPDCDLVSYWLADLIDERGWGIRDDSFSEMDQRRAAGEEIWFNLGDRDLKICQQRQQQLATGARLTETLLALREQLVIQARVLPASDEPVRTYVRVQGRWLAFQEFMIRTQVQGPIEAVEFRGAETARPSPEVSATLDSAELIVVGPSNPVASIGPILAIPELKDVLQQTATPVIAVSPIVGGKILKGPTAEFMSWHNEPATTQGVVNIYRDLIDGIVCDEPLAGVHHHQTDLAMPNQAARVRLAESVLRAYPSRYV